MLNFKTKIFLMFSFLVLGGVSAANAQFSPDIALKFDISHSFIINDATLPAGTYTIMRASRTNSSSLLTLRGDNGKSIIFDTITTSSAKGAADTQLVFNEVDGNHFLSSIWMRGDTEGIGIPQTNYEKRLIAEQKAKSEASTSGGSDR